MPWQDNYLQAKLDGVPFFIDKAGYKSGRKIAEHEYPDRDVTDYEDLGLKKQVFTLSAYVVGDDYLTQRDNLEEALNKAGPKILVHPYRGEMTVYTPDFSEDESTERGRMATFAITFRRKTDEEALTFIVNDTVKKVNDAKTTFLDAVDSWFEDVYTLAKKPSSYIQTVRDTIDDNFRVIENAKKIASANAEFKRQIENAIGDVIALSLDVQALINETRALANWDTSPEETGAIVTQPDEKSIEANEMFEGASEPIPNKTLNGDATYYQVKQLLVYNALGAVAGLMPYRDFGTTEDATVARNNLFEKIDRVSQSVFITDAIFTALRELREAVYEDSADRILRLPETIEIDINEPTNALAVSYELYGTTGRAEEIARSNDVIHPGFISTGKLKVKTA
jgi:prophage DNA circulation protein